MFKRFKRSEHERVEELLSAYIDGELSVEKATLVEKHLRECSACTQDLETLRQTVNLVRQLPAVSPPRSFTISHLVVPERPWAWGYVYLKGATALAALLLIVLLAGDLGLQYLWAPRMAVPAPAPMALEATVEAPEAEIEVPASPAREALDQMEAQKVEETVTPAAEATPPAERLGAALPSPEPTPTPELVAAAESPLPSPVPEEARSERFSALLPTLRLLEGALLGAFLILGGATALVAWRRMVSQ
ncbi:MAG: anti-sigma factor family protein [Anaerolineae bacterium]